MKFDMSAAWAEAVRMVGANRDVLLVVAGVFFFLPYVAFMLLFTNQIQEIESTQAAGSDALRQAAMSFYGEIWWVVVLMAVVQGIGMLGLLALLSDRNRPTVGQAIVTGAKYLLPYLGAQLIVSFLMGLILLIPITVLASGAVGVGVLVSLLALGAMAFLFARFLLVPPVVAIEHAANPFAALGRSWRLTKGHALRIFLFIFLIAVALIIVTTVLNLAVGIIFALGGTQSALIGQAIVSGLVNAAFLTIFLAALAAIHRQLARDRGPSATDRAG